MRLVGCHKVAVPRLNEYKVPILPQVQRSVVSPFHRPSSAVSCAQVYSTINQLSSRASNTVRIVLSTLLRSNHHIFFQHHTKRLPLCCSAWHASVRCASGNVQSPIRTSRPCQSHTSNIARLVSALRESFCSLLFLETEWVSRDHPFDGVTSYFIIVLGCL
ncbi:hypothetical protein B0H14DRAFT_3041933 [Mycena olivaceomarginata]|nr:hypothetical protein B0H14DRAFT_3041933 [Mycena olivaceomarginata]